MLDTEYIKQSSDDLKYNNQVSKYEIRSSSMHGRFINQPNMNKK